MHGHQHASTNYENYQKKLYNSRLDCEFSGHIPREQNIAKNIYSYTCTLEIAHYKKIQSPTALNGTESYLQRAAVGLLLHDLCQLQSIEV